MILIKYILKLRIFFRILENQSLFLSIKKTNMLMTTAGQTVDRY
jgi:hypothetical protein